MWQLVRRMFIAAGRGSNCYGLCVESVCSPRGRRVFPLMSRLRGVLLGERLVTRAGSHGLCLDSISVTPGRRRKGPIKKKNPKP